MCGIYGYVGKSSASVKILEGLKRLEYRGYDSWGIAVAKEKKIHVVKYVGAIGDIASLVKLPEANIGIGHTRWATHGGVTDLNAHPHYSTDESFILAQNGIVENFQVLKAKLIKKGYKFKSETDTEVIVHLIEDQLKSLKSNDLKEAVIRAFSQLEGRNTIIILTRDGNRVIAVKNGSPLVIGIGKNKDEYFFASDTLSFAHETNKAVVLKDYDLADFNDGSLSLFNIQKGKKVHLNIEEISSKSVMIDKCGYDHFMIKEIVEQKDTIKNVLSYTPKELRPLVSAIKSAKTVYTVGAGTAGFAAGQIAYFLRTIAGVNAIELRSYEYSGYERLFKKDDVLLAVSQSGETADTIEVLDHAKKKKMNIASIVNMLGSTITRNSDFAYFSQVGPEICVASTKVFTSQITFGYILASTIAGKYESAFSDINNLTSRLNRYFNKRLFEQIKKIVSNIYKEEHFFVLGKGQNQYIALEGALKVKEITYKHFEGFAAGELKHGVIALIEKGTPVFAIISNDKDKEDMLNAVAQVKARGAKVIAIAEKNNDMFDYFLQTPDFGDADSIMNIIPFQLISYFLGVKLKRDPDKPRNLAKSVTVK